MRRSRHLQELGAGRVVIAQQGESPPGVHLLLAGSLEMSIVDADGREARSAASTRADLDRGGRRRSPGAAVLRVRMLAASTSRWRTIPAGQFIDADAVQPAVFDRVMHQVRPVVGRLTAIEQNRERLASLGTMAAGLAHELNNPAAAARRAAADLAEALEVIGSTVGQFVESGSSARRPSGSSTLQREALDGAPARSSAGRARCGRCRGRAARARSRSWGCRKHGGSPSRWRRPGSTGIGSRGSTSAPVRRRRRRCGG